MLVNLDNEVHFKRVFTDVDVFCAFVKDVLGIDMHIKKVETEKVLMNKVSAIKFRMDLFAEDKENRTVVEIQKVDYDYSYDRFTHYFLGNLIDMQRDSKTYKFAKDVYIIVVVTSAYRVSDKTGQPLKDDVLITDINARTLSGEVRDMYNHKMVILNTTYVNPDTPAAIRDWSDLISESMNHPYDPKINTSKPGIAKAVQLAEIDNVSPEELADAKIQEMRKVTVALAEDVAREEGREEGREQGVLNEKKATALNMAKKGMDVGLIADITGLSIQELKSFLA
jgi:predicted transposase/invertase (TIGR01784 family)